MTKNYREYIGRLAQNGETGRCSVFMSHMGIIQFKLTHIIDVEKLEIIIKNSEKQTF